MDHLELADRIKSKKEIMLNLLKGKTIFIDGNFITYDNKQKAQEAYSKSQQKDQFLTDILIEDAPKLVNKYESQLLQIRLGLNDEEFEKYLSVSNRIIYD